MTDFAPLRDVFADFIDSAWMKSYPTETFLGDRITKACWDAFPADPAWQCDDEDLIVSKIMGALLVPLAVRKTEESIAAVVRTGVREALNCMDEEKKKDL